MSGCLRAGTRLALAAGGLALALLPAPSALAQAADPADEPAALAAMALGADPGAASVAVWRDGRLLQATVRAPATAVADAQRAPVPLYEIGSISKVFTGLLVAQAVERGELALDDTLGRLLKGKLAFASPEVAGITLRQLLTHRSCLPRQFGDVRGGAAVVAQLRQAGRAALWAALAAQRISGSPPCRERYSNYGLAVVGELLSELQGQPWSELVRRQITAPLGLTDTAQHLGDQASRLEPAFDGRKPAQSWDMAAFAGAGGLRASVQDLVAFGRAIAQGRAGPLGAAAERLVQPLARYEGGWIGYAVFIDGPPERRTWSHDGLTGGYRAQLVIHPDTGMVMAALASNSQAPVGRVTARIAAARYPVSDARIALDTQALPQYQGIYRISDELSLHCVVHEGQLFVRSTGNVFRAYQSAAPDVFTRPAGGARLSFQRQGDSVIGLTLEQSGRSFTATRTADRPPDGQVLGAGAATAYAGRFAVPRLLRANTEFDVVAQDGQLTVRSSAARSQPVFPMAGHADRFRYEGVRAELQFERDAQGRVVALVLHENGEMRAQRVAQEP